MTIWHLCPEIVGWIRGLSANQPVYFPHKHGQNSFRFKVVVADSDLQLSPVRPSVVPPVKLMIPAREELLSFSHNAQGESEVTPSLDTSERIIAGVRPCDLKGIFLMDQFLGQEPVDPYYLARREHTAIIAFACDKPCDDSAFCASVDSLDHHEGADVFITKVKGDQWLVEGQSHQGESLLANCDFVPCDDGPARKIGAVAKRAQDFGRKLSAPVSDLPEIINQQWNSTIWDKHVENCFSCGTCNLVCPTCYCFDMFDDLNLDATSGIRGRTWDSCMLPHFASVAGGHNFRPQPQARQRHRVKRKFEYLPQRFGYGSACVGCGRCGRQCTSSIDIFDIVNDLVKAGVQP